MKTNTFGAVIALWIAFSTPCLSGLLRKNAEPSYPPTFVVTPPLLVYAKPDEPLILPCHVDAMPVPNYQWLVDGREANWIKPFYHVTSVASPIRSVGLPYVSNNHNTSGDKSVAVLNAEHTRWYLGQIGVTVEFKPGVYQCTAWNAFGRVISSPVQVRFARLGMIKEHQEQSVTIRGEEPIRLNCSVTSSEPTATIRWMMRADDGSVEFVRENRTRATDDDGNLYLLEPTFRKHQVFVCAVNNPVLRTIKTGPDVHVYKLDRVKDQRWTVRHRPHLVYHSNREQIALVNHSLTLRCLITGYPLPDVNWQWAEGEYNSRTKTVWNDVGVFRDIDQLPKSFGVHIRHDGTQLVIPSVKLHNAGTYRCVAKVQRHTEMDTIIPMISFKVAIEGEPTFSREPENTIVPVFGTAVMQCAVDEEATQPPAQVMWLLNGGSIDQYLDGHRKLRRFDDLYIHNATIDDIAVFQCQISNVHGRRVSNAYLHVWQQPPSILQSIPEEKCVAEGTTITLPCRTMGAPKASIQWLRNGINIRPSAQWMGEPQQKYHVTTDGHLQIKQIAIGDSGKYTCIASNKYGDSQATGRLTVRKRTRIVSGPRMVLGHVDRTTDRSHGIMVSSAMNNSGNRVEQVIENTSVWLRCDVNTDPMEISHLRMVWKKDDETLNVDALKSSGRLGLSADGTALNIVGIKPSDTGIYACSAHSRLDSDNASVHLIVQGKPAAPRQLALTCSSASALSPFARLQWQLGPYNNPPVDHAVIEFVAGTYRPLAPTLTHYRRDLDRRGSQAASFQHPSSGNASVERQSLKAMWMQETVSRARQLAKKLIFTNRWSRIQPVASRIVENYVTSQHPNREDIDPSILSPSTDMEQAFVRLHADVFYHFRVRLVNRIGQSEPSFIVPELDSQSVCHLPPEPVSTVPNVLFVYGTHPHNLRIRWPPLPPIEHNGPGLIYKLTITCLDCQLGPIKPLTNLTVVTDWSVGELELEQLTTRELIGREQYERVRHWQVETFRTYEVNLTTENMFGSTVTNPLVQTGQSGEGIPTVLLEPPRAIFVGSQNATLTWRRLTQLELNQKILGYFRGFRLEWCEAQLTEELCNFYKAHQDYVVKVPPVWSVPELRTSGLSKANHAGKLADEVSSKRVESKDEPSRDSFRDSRTTSDSSARSTETNSSIAYINGSYVAELNGLPGKTRIKAWLRVLNIQFAGPPSDPVIFITSEGVPEAVPEIVATFVGVTHVELSWVKPLKINGDLIAYDLEITQVTESQHSKTHSENLVKKYNRESESSGEQPTTTEVKHKTINDPEQLATRISGLRMDTEYDITIWPRTKAGRGQKSDLRIRTAQLTRNAESSPFLVNSVPTSPNSVNICLAHPLNFPVSRPLISDNKGIRESTEARRMTAMASVDSEAIHGPWQNEQVFTPSNQVRSGADWSNSPSPSSPSHFPKVESDMFYAQFRTVGDEYWEETQREFQKPWIVLSNLKPNHEYEIRVVTVTASGESTVSQSKIIHVPTPPESWFTGAGLFTQFTGFQNSTVFIGSACTFILLLSSVVATVFLACWCRRRHNRQQHLRQRSCQDGGLRQGQQQGTYLTTGQMYNTLKDSGHNTSTINNDGNGTSTLSVRPTMDLSLTTSIHTTEPLLSNSNIPDALKPDPNCCVWVDRVTDPCAMELNTYNPGSMNQLQLGPDLTQSLMRKRPENPGLLACSHIPLTDVGRPSANCESTFQSFTSRTFNL